MHGESSAAGCLVFSIARRSCKSSSGAERTGSTCGHAAEHVYRMRDLGLRKAATALVT